MNNQTQTAPVITLNLSPAQFDALRVFLERTDMRGHEVPKFLEIAQAMRAAVAPAPSSKNEVEASV
jgi:hypothetical protein